MLFTSMFICSLSKKVQEQLIVVFIPLSVYLEFVKKCNYRKRNISQSKANAVAFWF